MVAGTILSPLSPVGLLPDSLSELSAQCRGRARCARSRRKGLQKDAGGPIGSTVSKRGRELVINEH